MPTRLVHLVIDAADPSALAAFWAAALGWEMAADEPDEAVVWPAGFSYPHPAVLPLVFVPVPEPKTGKNRIHLDLASASVADQEAAVDRIRGLGAVPADIGQGQVPWVVLADPEGNEFCVLDPRPVYRDTGPLAAVVVDCTEPAAMARFWSDAAGWPAQATDQDFASLRSTQAGGPYLELLRSADPKTVKNRIHTDVAPFPADDQGGEVARLRKSGATPVDIGQGGDVSWVVLADPEGNEFCVLSPR
jgi:predicted enzyme related to lactoylglutathione lyase